MLPSDETTPALPNMARLLEIMAALRDPEHGCPWDKKQDFASISRYTIEESYEVADAIASGNLDALRRELGDLLFHVVFYARMAEEQGAFTFEDIAAAGVEKMIRRHPHVFGDDAARARGITEGDWENLKAAERAEKAEEEPTQAPGHKSLLEDIPAAMPALSRALKLQQRAARCGFEWTELPQLLDKLQEEIGELKAELAADSPPERVRDELGDVLFVLTNLGRHRHVDAEEAVRSANAKFERRFHYIEQSLAAAGRTPFMASLPEMEALWREAKLSERAPAGKDTL